MEFSMPLPNQTVKNKETIMSTKLNTNLKPVELTLAELNSVAGGNQSDLKALQAASMKANLEIYYKQQSSNTTKGFRQ
jgi:hypothetical protein